MPDLTDEEKARIRAEIDFREKIRREIEAGEPRKARWILVLNSPFVITIVGGIMAALILKGVENSWQKREREAEVAAALFERRYDHVGLFCDDLETSIMTLLSIQSNKIRRSCADDEYARKKMSEADYQRVSKQLREEGIGFNKFYNEHAKPNGLFVKIRALYKDGDGKIAAGIGKLDKRLGEIQLWAQAPVPYEDRDKCLTELQIHSNAVSALISELVDSMIEDIKPKPVPEKLIAKGRRE